MLNNIILIFFYLIFKMALISGAILTEEIIKDVVIPWWVSTEVIGATSAVIGGSTATIIEEVK